MTFRHFLKQILQPLPGFAGMFQRREQLREHARTIEAMRTQLAEQNHAIGSLRACVRERDAEIAALREENEKQNSEMITVRVEAEAALAQAISGREQAEEAKWQAIRQREQAEEARWQAEREREQADDARWRAEREREQADESKVQAIRERDQADELKVQALRERDQHAAMHAEAEAAKHLQWKDVPHLEKQGLFVLGHVRSGTSILMRALNTCPDIFLLAEANIYVEGMRTGFARWFNQMTYQLGNTNSKAAYCPVAPEADSNAPETFQWLGQRFRYVGEKVAFRSEKLGFNPRGYFEFQARHFFTSQYLCIIRNPTDVLKSSKDMFKAEDLRIYAESYLHALQTILEVSDTFPNVFVLFHERVNQRTFDIIGARLGVDLEGAFATYDKQYQVEGRWSHDASAVPLIETLKEAHRQVRDAFSPDTLRELPNSQFQRLARYMRALRAEAVLEP